MKQDTFSKNLGVPPEIQVRNTSGISGTESLLQRCIWLLWMSFLEVYTDAGPISSTITFICGGYSISTYFSEMMQLPI